jgi:hypothetical protein
MRKLIPSSVLALFTALFVLQPANAQKGAAARGEVLALVREAEAGKDFAEKAARAGKRYGRVTTIMRVYNPTTEGGIGFGPEKGDSLEQKLLDLARRELTPDRLKKESAELARLAHINLVVAEMIRPHAPLEPVAGRGKKEWDQDVENLKKVSRGLLEAVRASDPAAVRAAAFRINRTCDRCHGP